jgi:hypothetical protein
MKTWTGAAQSERAAHLLDLYRAAMFDCVDERAGWHGAERTGGFREKVWHCMALLEGDDRHVTRANAILEVLELKPCHFTPMSCLQILIRHDAKLTRSARTRLAEYVRGSLPGAADPGIHYTMYNDNFASLSCFTLITGGELLDDARAVQAGRAMLEGLRDLFTRRGTVMEYCSPTYTPVNTFVLAQIAACARERALQELALRCEERMWAEIVTHWHTPSSRLAGPYSRAYWVDTVGHPHGIHALLWISFGALVFSTVTDYFFPPRPGQVIHIGLQTLMLPNAAWFATGTCHVPDHLARMLVSPRYPREVSCTSESLPSLIRGERTWSDGRREAFDNPWEYPGFAGPNTTYLAEDYALGAGYSSYHDGALTETFHLTYRKRRPARRLEDTGVVVSRYIFNDKKPEQENYYSVFDSVHGPEALRDEARKWGIQSRNCALYVYRPKPFECHEVRSMKLSVLFPEHFAAVEEIWLGDRRLPAQGGESEQPCPVFVRDGPLYMAFLPLSLTDHGRTAAVRVETWDGYRAISFYNYAGPARSFDPREMLLTSSGFVVHVCAREDHASFDAFRRDAACGSLTDTTAESEGGETRWIHYRHPRADLRFAITPRSEGILVATVDGRPRSEPVFAATGLDPRRLPFLG